MSRQTSQMYGIKVKETINYAEMGDISLYYEDALWTVKSNFENVWSDGIHYGEGDTIVTFQDGEVATFTMMGQHTDVTPYINKLYSVYSNASENPQAGNISVEYRITNSDRPHGGYSEVYEIVIFKLVNGLIQDRKYISSEDVRKYKIACDHQPVPAWNLTVDWNYTNPQSGYPMKSWVIRSNSNYIKYEEQYYKVGEDLDVFEYNDPILMAITDETQKHETKKKVGEPPLVVVTERVDGGRPTSWSWNRENIVHDVLHTHKDVYYNGHRHKAMYLLYSKTSVAGAYKIVKGLAFAWADPYWFLVANTEGMEYNGQILKKGQLIKAWSPGDSLNLYIKKNTAVRKPKTDVPYDNITYELLATGDTNVTVIRLVNDEEPPDSRVIVATSDSPKVCWGIELRVEGPNWTIYSKNNFIKYNGRTYKKNKSILSFGLDEELHIEIKDEENKYYIKSSITYHVTNEAADSVNYKVRTSKMDHNIIIEKSVNGSEEPWVRVNTYDAIIIPYDYEDLSLEFNTVNRSWILRALSDNVYSDGVKYDTNETIAEWHYTEIKELNHIEALKDSEENIKVAATTTGGGTEFGQDLDEFVPDDYQDFEVLHSSTKALWKVLSNSDDTWISGINYRKGDVILEVADKTFVDPFTVSVRYYDVSQHAYSYRTYSISLTYSALTNKTNLIIDPTNGNPIVFNDKTVNEGDVYSITKQNCKSIYGYIWKRDMPGPTPPGPDVLSIIFAYANTIDSTYLSYYESYVKGIVGSAAPSKYKTIQSVGSWSNPTRWNFRIIPPSESFNGRIFTQLVRITSSATTGTIYYSDDFGETFNYVRGNFPDAGRRSSSNWCPSQYCFLNRDEFYRVYLPVDSENSVYKYVKYRINSSNHTASIVEERDLYNADRFGIMSETNNSFNSYNARSALALPTYKIADSSAYNETYDILTDTITSVFQDTVNELKEYFASLQSYSEDDYDLRREYTYLVPESTVTPVFSGPSLNSDHTLKPPDFNNVLFFDVEKYCYSYHRFVWCHRIMWRVNTSARWNYEDSVLGEGPCICIKFDLYNDTATYYSTPKDPLLSEYENFGSTTYYGIVPGEWVKDGFYNYFHDGTTFYVRKFNEETGLFETVKTYEDGDYINIPLYTGRNTVENIKMNFGSTVQWLTSTGGHYECTIVGLGHSPSGNVSAPYIDFGVLTRGTVGPSNYNKKLMIRLLWSTGRLTNQGVVVFFDNPDMTGSCFAVTTGGTFS